MSASGSVLEVQNIHTFIGQFHILEGVSVSVPQGSISVLLGAQRRGQDDDAAQHHGLDAAARGIDHF